jgi:hypothetical protein
MVARIPYIYYALNLVMNAILIVNVIVKYLNLATFSKGFIYHLFIMILSCSLVTKHEHVVHQFLNIAFRHFNASLSPVLRLVMLNYMFEPNQPLSVSKF